MRPQAGAFANELLAACDEPVPLHGAVHGPFLRRQAGLGQQPAFPGTSHTQSDWFLTLERVSVWC